MDQFVFVATLVGMIGSLCTIAGFIMKVIERKRSQKSSHHDENNV